MEASTSFQKKCFTQNIVQVLLLCGNRISSLCLFVVTQELASSLNRLKGLSNLLCDSLEMIPEIFTACL